MQCSSRAEILLHTELTTPVQYSSEGVLSKIADLPKYVKKLTLSSTTSSQTYMLLRFLITRGTVLVSLGVWKKLPVYLKFKVEIGLNLQKTEHNQFN